MSVSQPPLSLTHYCIDPQLAGVLIANMLESWLTADSALAPTRETVDEHEDHRTPPQQAGGHLYPPLFRVLDYSECPVVARYYLLSFNDLRWRGGLDCSA